MTDKSKNSLLEMERLKVEQENLKRQQEELKRQQEELKRQQGELKLQQDREKLALEREKSNLKWFNAVVKVLPVLITVGIGTFGVAHINNVYQNEQSKREQNLKQVELQMQQEKTKAELDLQEKKAKAERQQAEMKYLGEYLSHALEDDIVRRLRFAEYFATLTTSEELKTKWVVYHQQLKALRDEVKANLPELREQVLALREGGEGEIKLAQELEKQLLRLTLESPLVEVAALSEKPRSIIEERFGFDPRKKFGLSQDFEVVTYVKNDFKDQGEVIVDHATGLMWQKSGSDTLLKIEAVNAYIDELNRQKFAGYTDWRLPTTNELQTLLEPERQTNGLFINPMFDAKQKWCWSNNPDLPGRFWLTVMFGGGFLDLEGLSDDGYVRAVRSWQD